MIIHSMFPWSDRFAHVNGRHQRCYKMKQLYPKKYSIHARVISGISGMAARTTGHPSLKYDHRHFFVTSSSVYKNLIVRRKNDCFCNLRMWKDLNKNQFDISYSHHLKMRGPKTGVNKTHNFSANNIGSGTIQERTETRNLSEVKQFSFKSFNIRRGGYRKR